MQAESGWRTMKRPGADEFLNYLVNFYELVIFADKPVTVSYMYIHACIQLTPLSHRMYCQQ